MRINGETRAYIPQANEILTTPALCKPPPTSYRYARDASSSWPIALRPKAQQPRCLRFKQTSFPPEHRVSGNCSSGGGRFALVVSSTAEGDWLWFG